MERRRGRCRDGLNLNRMSDADSILLFEATRPAVRRRALREYAGVLRKEVAGGRGFTCLLTDDEALRKLNREFLEHDYATDVLSFPAGDHGGGSLGDVAISLDRAKEQAAEFGHTVDEEVRVLMLHGLLHLLGHDHEKDAGQMRRVETRWRRKLGLPVGLIARSAAKR